MATKSQSTRKKTPTKKAPVKKTAPARSTTSTRVRTKRAEAMQSFKVSKPEESFFTFRITRQTFYWIILMIAVVACTLWILKLQSDVNELYDQIQLLTEAPR
jgi:hypothetical protein